MIIKIFDRKPLNLFLQAFRMSCIVCWMASVRKMAVKSCDTVLIRYRAMRMPIIRKITSNCTWAPVTWLRISSASRGKLCGDAPLHHRVNGIGHVGNDDHKQCKTKL